MNFPILSMNQVQVKKEEEFPKDNNEVIKLKQGWRRFVRTVTMF